ncbi:type I restriction endonuclease subunit R [Sphaerotilus sp.]|uniref:type I restriction endonuclease subunit R n=1 Tax=Sphaerotilus sp. TaxID=2093942 RepID=UPI0025EC7894|nr:type I restriction endonuclease [Sphaerotilus sp.]
MTGLHTEIHFEHEICEQLAARGWLHDPTDARRYDRATALFPDDLAAWVQTTQPDAWDRLLARHGEARAPKVLAEAVRKALDVHGVLHVLREGVGFVGHKRPVSLCQFRPALAMNAELQARHAANRLRVVRQVVYSAHHANEIDLVLFLNGLPLATIELKSHFTQTLADAITQYQRDRLPTVPGQNLPEPLLAFPGGALVHFAVTQAEAAMTTRLAGADTVFLPFNQGRDGGAGNPANPHGHATAYLWEQVWTRESWLDLIGRYLVAEHNDKGRLHRWIFPRYHQLDATRRLVQAVRADGPGRKYLVQHSAGSGKTNSIAWTAHFLADLHDDHPGPGGGHAKVFHSVLVISDRTVLDTQLREALTRFERTKGVVAEITGAHSSSKSRELADALAAGKKIIVCTLQTFPHALAQVRELAATEGKRFAVIADEAHSSQSNDTAARLKLVLSAAELAELDDGGEVDAEDLLAAQMSAKAGGDAAAGITWVAFTATPKDKTLQLFGTRPDPTRDAAADNLPAPFHVYPMRQAIEEGFILDVLKHYTSYQMAFQLAHGDGNGPGDGTVIDSAEVDRSEAMKGIMGWVRLHGYNIAQRVQVVVEHYRRHVQHLLGGRAKAMVVTGSRREAVRWQLAMRRYIAEHGYALDALVAFSGEIDDPESGPDPFTETSPALNPRLHGRDIRTAFQGADVHLLLVANKFQTGFDEPLLSAMYVDKRLGGVQAVQTLSRLNRCHPGKDTTYVVDFVNEPAEILAAFQRYHATAELADVTDPTLVFTLRAKLDAQGLYGADEVERVVAVALKGEAARQSELSAVLTPVANRLLARYAEAKRTFDHADPSSPARQPARDRMDALILFKRDLGAYLRLYGFLSQVFDYGDTAIEKRAIFFKLLVPLLDFGREREGVDLSALRLTAYTLKDLGQQRLNLGEGDRPKIEPTREAGGGQVQDKDKVLLDALIAKVNALFTGELSPGDKLVYVNEAIRGKLLEHPDLVLQARNNTEAQFASSPDLHERLIDAVIEVRSRFGAMSDQALGSEETQRAMLAFLLGPGRLWETLRARAG